MKIYKFKDIIDEHFAFVMAHDIESAKHKLSLHTALPFILHNEANAEDFPFCIEKLDGKPGIWINNILPF